MMKKICIYCVHFKYRETKVIGRIEHKNKNGEVWMTEPEYGVIPEHCECCNDLFKKWWAKNKDIKKDVVEEIDCDKFDTTELNKLMDEMLNTAQKALEEIKVKDE